MRTQGRSEVATLKLRNAVDDRYDGVIPMLLLLLMMMMMMMMMTVTPVDT